MKLSELAHLVAHAARTLQAEGRIRAKLDDPKRDRAALEGRLAEMAALRHRARVLLSIEPPERQQEVLALAISEGNVTVDAVRAVLAQEG